MSKYSPALWTGDRVTGHNRFTDETVAGSLVSLEEGFDGVVYATVETRDGESRFVPQDAAQLAAWIEDYSLSELYDHNVLGGRP